MKSELKIKKVKETVINADTLIDAKTFPALFKNTHLDYIVLFTNMTTGIVVHSDHPIVNVGDYGDSLYAVTSDNWEYLGSNVVVKLSNKKLK